MKNTPFYLSLCFFYSCASLTPSSEDRFSLEVHQEYCHQKSTQVLSGEGRVSFQLSGLQGEYPADLLVSLDQLVFQVTDPFGGVLASIEKKDGKIQIQDQGRIKKIIRENVVWRGIPLQGMEKHFLAKPQCDVRSASLQSPFVVMEKNGKKETLYQYKKVSEGWVLSQWKTVFASGETVEVNYEQYRENRTPGRVLWKTSQGQMIWQWKE